MIELPDMFLHGVSRKSCRPEAEGFGVPSIPFLHREAGREEGRPLRALLAGSQDRADMTLFQTDAPVSPHPSNIYCYYF